MPLEATEYRGCTEFQNWSRSRLLRRIRRRSSSSVALTSVPQVSLTDSETNRDVLLVVLLRGGMDGLTTVVPYGDPNLYSPTLRPDLAVPPPGDPDGAIDLDGFFGLAPAMAPLLPAYASGQLAVVHATGSPDPTRSHFDAFSYLEYGIPLQPLDVYSGWLARHLQIVPPTGNGLLRAAAISGQVPKTLADAPATLPIADPSSFAFPGSPVTSSLRQAVIEAAHEFTIEPLASAAKGTIDTIAILQGIDFLNYAPSGGATYPGSAFGEAVKSVAAMVKADIGLEAATVELGSWDTHNQQGVQAGDMANLMADLSTTLAALHIDMQDRMDRFAVVVMSEFGRRADQNGSQGTDHGHGNCMLVMGGHIAGGQVIADWNSGELLHPDLLYQGDSLQVTIDYRDIIAEIVQNRLDNADLATVFPNYTPTFRGITN